MWRLSSEVGSYMSEVGTYMSEVGTYTIEVGTYTRSTIRVKKNTVKVPSSRRSPTMWRLSSEEGKLPVVITVPAKEFKVESHLFSWY